MDDFSYENLRRVCYDGGATFIPVCEACGRFVKADDEISISDEHGLADKPNATCSKHGRIKMIFEGFIALLLTMLLFAPLHADTRQGDLFIDQIWGDCDCNGQINIGDAVFLLNYIFAGGPEPDCHKTGMVEPMMIDTNWIEAYVGGDTLRKVDGLRRVYTIGEHDKPNYYLLIPEAALPQE